MLKPIKKLLASKPILSYCIFITSTVLLLLPGGRTPNDVPLFPNFDKLAHIIIFGACAFALYFDFIVKRNEFRPLLKVMLFTYALLFFGGMVEVLQELFLDRTGSTSDFIADWVGVTLGFIVAYFFAPNLLQFLRAN